MGGGGGKAVRKGGRWCTVKDVSCTVSHPRVGGAERVVMRIVTNRRENEPERNVLSIMNYVCSVHDVTLLLLYDKMLCKNLSTCVNVIVFYSCVYIVQLLVGPVSLPGCVLLLPELLCKTFLICVNVVMSYFWLYIVQRKVDTVSLPCGGLLLLRFFSHVPRGKMLINSWLPVYFVRKVCTTDGGQSDVRGYHNTNAAVRKNCCVKMKANFREYNLNQGRHRARSSRSWRSTEVVFLCTLTLQ
jgi:hypothetical protein